MRTIALALFVLALANPSITREDRDPLTSVAVVVVDKSPSQEFGDRQQQTEAVRAALAERLGRMPGIEVRFVEAGQADGETDGTRLFAALSSALSDVPHDRVAGALMITDGRVHDVPSDAAALGFAAPVHGLITGHANERDRRVVLTTAPRFGIVGQTQTITFRVEDQGASPGTAQVTIRRDGETIDNRNVRVGASMSASTCRSPMPGRTSSRSKHRRSTTSSPASTTAPSSRSTACATSCASCWSPASRMRASAPGAICSSPTPPSTSCTSPSCVRRRSRTARRSTSSR